MATMEALLDPKLAEGNRKVKDSQAMINKMMTTIQREKAYNPQVVSAAAWEFLESLDGNTPVDRLESFNSATGRKESIRRLCFKSFLLVTFRSSGVPEDISPERWARILFMAAGVKGSHAPKEETIKYYKRVCGTISEFLRSDEFSPEEVEQAIVRSTDFVWSISELNRRTPPSKQEFEQQLHDAVEDISQSRKQPIDLFHILEIFGSAPHKFIQCVPVLMRPQLERMHHPHVMGCLKKVLNFISDNLEWDFDNMPTTVANLQKHPGVPMAAEVAKCMSFGELYDVLIRVVTELVLGKNRGFDKCETKLKERVGPNGEEPSLLSLKQFRELFGLPAEAYDKKGEPLTNVSEKSRAHSYIASVVLVPFLQGLYEARGNYFNIELAIDHLFTIRGEELKKARETTRSLDDKRSFRKALVVLRKAHTTLISALETCATDSKKNLKEVLASQMSIYESIGLEPQAILSTAINDLNRLKKSPKTRIVEARSLLEMAKEAPEGTVGLPPSPWAAFFGQNLKTISKVLKAAGAAVINLDTISNLISDHLVKTLASNMPINAVAKKNLTNMSEFKTVVQVSWENARGRLPLDVNNRLVDLLKEVHAYTRAKPKAKHPDVLCCKLLGLTRPFVQEYFRCLYEVDGQDLYTTIVSLTEEDQGMMEKTKSKAEKLKEEQLERATSRAKNPELEL